MSSQGCKYPVQGRRGGGVEAGHKSSGDCRRCALDVPEPAFSSSAVQCSWPKECHWPGAVLELSVTGTGLAERRQECGCAKKDH